MTEEVDLDSKEFIESIVGSPVSKWKSKNACAAGDNLAGSVKTLTVTTQAGQELHLIFKHIPDNCPEWIIQGQVYRIENGLYRTVAPLLKKFAASKNWEYEPPLPKYFKGFNNDKSDYIVLQDIRPLGYLMPDKRRTLTFPEMKLVLQELGKFHATAYALIRHEGEKIFETEPDFHRLTQPLFPEEDKPNGPDTFDNLIQVYFEVGAALVQDKLPHLSSRIENIVPNAWKIRREATLNPKYFQTVIHCDLWTNNLMVKYDESGKQPVDVKFIDFQFVHLGNVFHDLMYLMFTSTTVAMRSSHLFPMLNTYYDAFTSALDKLKCPPPVGFTRGFFTDEFIKWHVPALVHMAFAVALQLGDFTGVMQEFSEQGRDEAMGDPEAIRQVFLRSPLALSRYAELFEEAAKLNLI